MILRALHRTHTKTFVNTILGSTWSLTAAATLGLLTLAAVPGCGRDISDKDVDKHQVSVAEVKRLMAEEKRRKRDDVIVLIDTRPPAEFAAGHIPGARNISLAAIRPKDAPDPALTRFQNIVIYANDPASASSRAMVKRLMNAGYSDVVLMAGGLYQWRVTGGEIVEGK